LFGTIKFTHRKKPNGGDNLTISASGTFTFPTALKIGKAYAITVLTQPSSPTQTCTVTSGTGFATAEVTMVQVACVAGTSSGNYTIGGTVVSLAGTGLVLQDNGGDNLNVSQSGGFTFATPLANGTMYTVTVFTQPSNPTQVCTVANGTGTANANVNNIVVTCSTATISTGGSVSGLDDTGLVLQNNGGSNLTICGNGPFTFANLIVSGGMYDVTVLTQPTTPAQTCTVTNGSGTTTSNIANLQVVCPAVFNTIGGQRPLIENRLCAS
jgi:hypothetical protein